MSLAKLCIQSAGSRHLLARLAACVLLILTGTSAHAQAGSAVDCSSFPNATLDGFVTPDPPSNINIDTTCTIRNFPADNPLDTNFSFFTQPGQNDERWLIVFDNVVHTGNMSCNSVLEHKIWFTNGSSTKIQEGCQNLLIPVEKIDKRNPPGNNTAAIGVPFTYRMTIPVLYDPNGDVQSVIDFTGSVNTLHGITIWDDLNATGVDMTFLGYEAYWEETGQPIPHTFSNNNGFLTWDMFPIVPAGDQFVLEVTVVLEDTPANLPGTQFINTAKWDFGRLIDGVFYEPLPGEWGVTEPMTIAAPQLVMTKTGPSTIGRTLNLGEWGEFGLEVHNIGLTDAWDVTIVDRLPDGPTGGMCDMAPEILDAQVLDGAGNPVPGKGPLTAGNDFTVTYTAAPSCELSLTMLTPAASIGPDEHLVIDYRTRLDADSEDAATLTNVAGVTQWFNGDAGNLDRQVYTRAITNGTPGVADHEDAHTTTVELRGYFFEKTVQNLTQGTNPADTAAPGDTLRYTLRLQTTDGALNDFTFYDDLGAMNAQAVFVPGSLSLVPASIPPGADTGNTDPAGGTNGAGIVDVRNLSLPLASEVSIQFDVTVDPNLPDGIIIANQADLLRGVKLADSDDPTVNGQASPDIVGDEDPTRIVVEGEPPTALVKANTQATAAIGETFSYRVTVPSAPHRSPLFDVRIYDDLAASAADLEFVSVTKVAGTGSWSPVNTGSATNLVIEDPVNGIDIPIGAQAVVEITVRLADSATNVAGLAFTNTASYTYNLRDGDPASERPGNPGTTQPMTVVEPELTLEKTGPLQMRGGTAGTFTLDIHNAGTSPAYGAYVTDVLPNQADGGMCDAAPANVTAQLFEADGLTAAAPPLLAGTDYAVTFNGDPACTLTLEMLTAAAAIGPDQRLIVSYEASLDADTQRDAVLTNIAGATEWFSLDVADGMLAPYARTYARVITDGTVGVLDHEDAHTVVEFTPLLIFEKTAVNVTSGEDPATVATPGDTLRYRLRIENASDTPVPSFDVRDEIDRLNADARFQAGTLSVVTVPAGADASNTDPNGGTAGTGLLDVRNLSIGGLGDEVVVEFEVTLVPVIADGTTVYNQSELLYNGNTIALSDDPYINDAADPTVAGDEDPTAILIESAPAFRIEKLSSYIEGDPNVLLAGETLRYTITVQNVGTDNATSVSLADQVPSNTSYVAGSTTLNGVAVADGASGSPLIDGILINAPGDTTPGNLNAAVPDNVATIVFDVVVYADVPDGTVISNQAFLTAADQGFADLPSDDPRTELPDDPTQDVVGNYPLLFAPKSAALQVDAGTPGIVDPGDVLRYTITVYNNGNVPATAVELIDQLPSDTIYVEDSTTLNGEPVGRPDGGVFPLEAGIPLSSADLTRPVPGEGEGVLSPGESAVVQFDLEVDGAAVPGTLITNQAVVYTAERPNLLTDGDGNPSTGPEPTVVVVGDAQQVSIVKEVAVVGGGPAIPGATLEYTVTVTNVGSVPAYYVTIYDDLAVPNPGYLSYVDQSAVLNGLPAGVTVAGTLMTADYFNEYGPLPPAETAVLRFRAIIDPDLAEGTTVTNIAEVAWTDFDPQPRLEASVSIDVGAIPNAGTLSGYAWHDADHDNTPGGLERPLQGWSVDLLLDDTPIRTLTTDADGFYRFTNVVPNTLPGETYSLRFRAPGTGSRTALMGYTDSDFTDGLQRIDDIDVQEGSNLLALNLPVDPNGVVYNAIGRTPVAGATVSLVDVRSGLPVPASCFDDPNQQDQVTVGNGYYKFDLNFSDPGCSAGMAYELRVAVPDASYVPGVSELIPPASGAGTPPFDVPACPGSAADAVIATADYCEAQPSEFAPPVSVPARSSGTDYHLLLTLDDGNPPGSAQLFNNHIPLDPRLDGAVAVTKTTPMVNVNRGQMIPYTITVTNSFGADLYDITVIDRFPAGFRYVEGSARFDGEPAEPEVVGRELIWNDLVLATDGRHEIKLLLATGAGLSEGEFVNRALAVNALTGATMSGQAEATVRLVPDPTFDCTDVTGKVFDDGNRNGYQDGDEAGIPGVRVVTATGLAATTDAHGRYHVTCAITPRDGRGSNFVLKLDDRTLPSGYRTSTRPVQVQRATRGKALRINFGASIHRVVGLDISAPVFEPGAAEMRPLWTPRVDLLVAELAKGPAVLRLSYVADVEDESLVQRRIDYMKERIRSAWQQAGPAYELAIEQEIYWRLGGPPKMPRETGR